MSMTATVSRLDSFRYWRGNEEATTEDWLKDISAPPNHRMDVGAAFQAVLENLSVGGECTNCSANGFSFNFKCDAAIPQLNPVYGRKDYGTMIVSGRAGLVDGKRVEVFKTTKRFEAEKRLDDYQWRLYLDLFDADEFVWNIFVIAPNNPDETSYDVVGFHQLKATRYPGLHDDCVSLVNDYHGIMSSIQEEETIMASKGNGRAKALSREVEMLTIHGDIVQETEDAILVDCGADKAVWLAKSQIEYTGARDDCDVEIRVPDWLAEEKGLHDGQAKPRAVQEGAVDASTPPTDATTDVQEVEQADSEGNAPAELPELAEPTPACRFKADVTALEDGNISLTVISTKGKEKAFTFSRDALRFEGDDVADLQVGYKGIDFILGWDMAVESGLAKHLKLKAPTPAPMPVPGEDQQEAAATATTITAAEPEIDDDEAPQTKPLKNKLRTETVRATVELTSEEKNECAKRITDALSSRTSLKEKASYYSSKAREAEKEAYKASEVFESGEEERDITCDVIGDFNTMELVYVESEWPHREIQRRHMTDKDRQLLLPIDQPAQPQPEPEAAVQPSEQEAAAEPEHVCETCRNLGDGNACEPCTIVNGDASIDLWKPANNEHRCTTCVHHGADYPDDCGTCQDDTDSLVNWKPSHPCFAPTEPEEAETVTLYGEVLEQRETETVFRVHYGDDDNTVAEFTIPNEQIQMPAFGDPASTQDMITLTRAYAIDAGIIAAPEDAASRCPMCKWNAIENCKDCFGEEMFETAAPVDEKNCASCAHCDVEGDTACAECGEGLLNFAPIFQAEQGQAESAGAVQ